MAGLFSGDLALFDLQNLKEPLAVFPLDGDQILTEVSITPNGNNYTLKFESAKGYRSLLAQKVDDMFSITEEEKMEPPKQEEAKEENTLHLTNDEQTVQAGLHSLKSVEVRPEELSPYAGDGKKKTVHFKRPTRLSGLEVVVAFESKDAKGEHVTREL